MSNFKDVVSSTSFSRSITSSCSASVRGGAASLACSCFLYPAKVSSSYKIVGMELLVAIFSDMTNGIQGFAESLQQSLKTEDYITKI